MRTTGKHAQKGGRFCAGGEKSAWNARGRKGFIFSLDLAIALVTVLLMLNLALLHFSALGQSLVAGEKKFELQKNALLLADSLVKNSDSGQPLLGAAVFDAERHRALGNTVRKEFLRAAKPASLGNFRVKALSLREKSGKEETFFSEENQGENCVAAERFVVADGEKALLRVVACEE